jgi:hypothetical protein
MQIAFTPPKSFDPLGLDNTTMAIYIAGVLCMVAMVYFVRFVEFVIFRLLL